MSQAGTQTGQVGLERGYLRFESHCSWNGECQRRNKCLLWVLVGSGRWNAGSVGGEWEDGPKRAGVLNGCLEIFSIALVLF